MIIGNYIKLNKATETSSSLIISYYNYKMIHQQVGDLNKLKQIVDRKRNYNKKI